MPRVTRVAAAAVVAAAAAFGGGAEALVDNDPRKVIPTSWKLFDLHAAFDGRKVDQRHFDECHWHDADPDLTIGFAHNAAGGLVGFMEGLLEDEAASKALAAEFVAKMTPAMWESFKADTGLAGRDAAAVRAGLAKLFKTEASLTKFDQRHKTGFNDHATNWFCHGWHTGSRLPAVATFQVRYWKDDMVGGAEKVAKTGKLDGVLGGIASMASWKSSGGLPRKSASYTGTVTTSLPFVPKATCRDSKAERHVDVPAVSYSWPYDAVPAACVGKGGANQAKLLGDYRALVTWQRYQAYKGKDARRDKYRGKEGGEALRAKDKKYKWPKCHDAVKYTTKNRDRMNNIWKQWFAASWGAEGDTPAQVLAKASKPGACVPHTGVYMERGTFEAPMSELNLGPAGVEHEQEAGHKENEVEHPTPKPYYQDFPPILPKRSSTYADPSYTGTSHLKHTVFKRSVGDEAGTAGGVTMSKIRGRKAFENGVPSVKVQGGQVVRSLNQ